MDTLLVRHTPKHSTMSALDPKSITYLHQPVSTLMQPRFTSQLHWPSGLARLVGVVVSDACLKPPDHKTQKKKNGALSHRCRKFVKQLRRPSLRHPRSCCGFRSLAVRGEALLARSLRLLTYSCFSSRLGCGTVLVSKQCLLTLTVVVTASCRTGSFASEHVQDYWL